MSDLFGWGSDLAGNPENRGMGGMREVQDVGDHSWFEDQALPVATGSGRRKNDTRLPVLISEDGGTRRWLDPVSGVEWDELPLWVDEYLG